MTSHEYNHDIDHHDPSLPIKKSPLQPHDTEHSGQAFRPAPDHLTGTDALKFSRGHAPYVGSIRSPSSFSQDKMSSAPPSSSLDIDWIYGMTPSLRGGVHYVSSSAKIVYPAAAVGVIYDPSNHSQKYFRQHTDDITCITPCRYNNAMSTVFATGQKASLSEDEKKGDHVLHNRPPVVCVWDSKDGEQLGRIQLAHDDRTVRCVEFSPSGKLLAIVCGDDKHTLRIYEWESGKQLAESPTDNSLIYSVSWNPLNESEVIITGKNVIKLYHLENGNSIKEKMISLTTAHITPQPFYCSTYSRHGNALVGTDDGHILVINTTSGEVAKKVAVGAGKVLCINNNSESGFVVGSSDRSVMVLDTKLTITHTIKVPNRVFSVSQAADGSKVVIGTEVNDVFVVENLSSLASNFDVSTSSPPLSPLLSGHWDGELWGIASHPSSSTTLLSAGEDNTIRLWDLAAHKQVVRTHLNEKKEAAPVVHKASSTSVHPPNQQARAVAVSPNGQHVAVGLNNGELAIYDAKTLTKITSLASLNGHGKRSITSQTGNWIQALSYSPSGHTLAVGTHGSIIALCDATTPSYDVKGVIKSHNSFITNVDWSVDGKYLQSNCGALELLFHKVADEKKLDGVHQVTEVEEVKDVEWATQTLLFSWPTQGIFAAGQDSMSVHSVSANRTKSLLATGDDRGTVKLFSYPCVSLKAEGKAYGGHSSHIPKVMFSADGKLVLSAGGHDGTIIQWKVV